MWLNCKRAAAHLGVSAKTLQRWADARNLPDGSVMIINNARRFDVDVIERVGKREYSMRRAEA